MKRGMLSLSKGAPPSHGYRQGPSQGSGPRIQSEPSPVKAQGAPSAPEKEIDQAAVQQASAAVQQAPATVQQAPPAATIRISGVLNLVMKSHESATQRIYAKQKDLDAAAAEQLKNSQNAVIPSTIRLPANTTGKSTYNYFHAPPSSR